MKLEQFKMVDSPALEYVKESTVITNREQKVKLYQTLTTWVVEKFSRGICVFRTEVQKTQPELLEKELRKIGKR